MLPDSIRENSYYSRLSSVRAISFEKGVSRDALESINDTSAEFAGICLAVVGIIYSLKATGMALPGEIGIFLIASVVFFGITCYIAVLALAAERNTKQYEWLSRLAFYLFTFSLLWMLFFVVLLQFGLRLPGLVAALLSLGLEVLAVLGLYGTAKLALRRYRERPERLDNKVEDAVGYVVLFAIFLSGFLTEALRIAADPSAASLLTPVGFVASFPFQVLPHEALATLLRGVWRVHLFGRCLRSAHRGPV